MGEFGKDAFRSNGLGREVLAGGVNALTLLSCIIVVPSLLFQAGMDFTGAYTAFMLVSLLGTLLIGRLTGSPLVIVPGIAVASWLVYGEIISHGHSWQAVLGVSFLASCIGVALLLSPLGKILLDAVPEVLRRSLMGGLGFMLVLQGLIQGRLLTGSPFDVMMFGNLSDPVAYLSLIGIFIVLALMVNEVSGALAIGTLSTAIIAWVQGFWEIPSAPFLLPEGLDKTVLQLDMAEGILMPEVLFSLLVLVLVESLGVEQGLYAAFPDEVRPSKKLLFGILGTGAAGALLGSLPPRLALESAAGIAVGGRRGWTSYATAFFLFLLLFCEPLAKAMASFGAITAPAITGAGFLMLWRMKELWTGDMADAAASCCLFLLMPLFHDVAAGIGGAIVMHVALKSLGGKRREVTNAEVCMAALFVVYFLCRVC
ncbi:MAG: NCS2 family permease [Selenomonadaceae bacterium]|nr:NCS2 family permease [Selenomonadaceae bacterium]